MMNKENLREGSSPTFDIKNSAISLFSIRELNVALRQYGNFAHVKRLRFDGKWRGGGGGGWRKNFEIIRKHERFVFIEKFKHIFRGCKTRFRKFPR